MKRAGCNEQANKAARTTTIPAADTGGVHAGKGAVLVFEVEMRTWILTAAVRRFNLGLPYSSRDELSCTLAEYSDVNNSANHTPLAAWRHT